MAVYVFLVKVRGDESEGASNGYLGIMFSKFGSIRVWDRRECCRDSLEEAFTVA